MNNILNCDIIKLLFSNKFNIDFIEKLMDIVDFDLLIETQELPEYFILKHINKIKNWSILIKKQKLSENFILSNIDKLNMKYISKYQYLSNDFIIKYKKKLYLNEIKKNPLIKKKFELAKKLAIDINIKDELINEKLSENFNDFIIIYKL
jgi:hypothetical protein